MTMLGPRHPRRCRRPPRSTTHTSSTTLTTHHPCRRPTRWTTHILHLRHQRRITHVGYAFIYSVFEDTPTNSPCQYNIQYHHQIPAQFFTSLHYLMASSW